MTNCFKMSGGPGGIRTLDLFHAMGEYAPAALCVSAHVPNVNHCIASDSVSRV